MHGGVRSPASSPARTATATPETHRPLGRWIAIEAICLPSALVAGGGGRLGCDLRGPGPGHPHRWRPGEPLDADGGPGRQSPGAVMLRHGDVGAESKQPLPYGVAVEVRPTRRPEGPSPAGAGRAAAETPHEGSGRPGCRWGGSAAKGRSPLTGSDGKGKAKRLRCLAPRRLASAVVPGRRHRVGVPGELLDGEDSRAAWHERRALVGSRAPRRQPSGRSAVSSR